MLPPHEGLVIAMSLDTHASNRMAERVAKATYDSLERRGLVTPVGKHTGRRHLTRRGYREFIR